MPARSTYEILSSLQRLPSPVVTLFKFDIPMHYFAVCEGLVLLCSLADADDDDVVTSWFVGPVPLMDTGRIMMGKLSLLDAIRKYCLYRLEGTPRERSLRPATREDYNEDYLPQPTFKLGFTWNDACVAYERLLRELQPSVHGRVYYLRIDDDKASVRGVAKIIDGVARLPEAVYRKTRASASKEDKKLLPVTPMSEAQFSVAMAASIGVRLFVPSTIIDESKRESQLAEDKIDQVLENAFKVLQAGTPSAEAIREQFEGKPLTPLEAVMDGIDTVGAQVEIAVMGSEDDGITSFSPSTFSPERAAEWKNAISQLKRQSSEQTESTRYRLRGWFETISGKKGLRFRFKLDSDAPQNEDFKNKRAPISGPIESDELIQKFESVAVNRPVEAEFDVVFREGKQPKFTLVDIVLERA
ncbi:MAG: hypothetical protein M5U25_15755 [Planctomycetota bacterium]|nr:hypothetical protein [Planctomycetota bacterium]